MRAIVKTMSTMGMLIDGSNVESEILSCVSDVSIEVKVSDFSHCSIVLREPPQGTQAIKRLKVGSTFDVESDGTRLFSGELDRIGFRRSSIGERVWTLEVSDRLSQLKRQSHVRVFTKTTPTELLEELVNTVGIQVESFASKSVIERLMQNGESDLEFIQQIAERFGLFFVLQDDILYLYDKRGVGEPLNLPDEEILEFEVVEDSRNQVASTRVSGWNVETNSIHSGYDGSGSDWGKGLQWVEGTSSDDDALERARAEMTKRCLGGRVISGVAEGNAELKVGVPLRVDEGSFFDGEYLIANVKHSFNSRTGYVTHFSSKVPETHFTKVPPIAAFGKVVRLDDPGDSGRVQVSLPAYENVEMGWLRVLTLGAGKNKGFVVLPDIDEEVLVLFPHGNLSSGIVLGGVFGSGNFPDWGISDSAVCRYTLTSRSGQFVRISDDEHSVRIENDSGSVLELGRKKLLVESKGDLEISAKGHTVSIIGRKVDFVKG